jgi:hypothetical protein
MQGIGKAFFFVENWGSDKTFFEKSLKAQFRRGISFGILVHKF